MPTPANCRFSETHEWFRTESDGTVTMGITQHAADALTDITFVQMKPAGSAVTAGGSVGEVESVKTSSEIYVPVGATVAAVNDAAQRAGLIKGWHGSANLDEIEIFDKGRIGTKNDAGFYGRGFYFTFGDEKYSPGEAGYYGSQVGEFYLQAKKDIYEEVSF